MTIKNKIINLFEAHDLFDTQGSPRNPNMWHSYPSTDYAILEDNAKKRIYCDMDGVIVDFIGAFYEKTGANAEEFELKYGKDAFWNLVESWGSEFWATLPWMKDGHELWAYIEPHSPTILTASMRTYQRKGKFKWIVDELGLSKTPVTNPAEWKGQSNIIFHKDKYKFIIEPGEILIDDTPEKINDWNKAGGVGILHKSATETIQQLKSYGI
jgi:hypothetical protein